MTTVVSLQSYATFVPQVVTYKTARHSAFSVLKLSNETRWIQYPRRISSIGVFKRLRNLQNIFIVQKHILE